MIDFRYHLISIIAVFLALGIGILMGSLVLGENLVEQLRRELRTIENTNRDLQGRIDELDREVEVGESFAQAAYPQLVASKLQGERVVMLTFEGTDGGALDEARNAIQDAGGTISGVVTATGKLKLDSQPARDELALLLSSSEDDADALRAGLGRALGDEAAAEANGDASDDGGAQGAGVGNKPTLDALIRDLESAGFLSVERDDDGDMVVPGAGVVIVGGGAGDPPFSFAGYLQNLGSALGLDAVPVVAAEPSGSTWGLVEAIRTSEESRAVVASVDGSESTAGKAALVLGLETYEDGVVGHYGVGPGAESILPELEQP